LIRLIVTFGLGLYPWKRSWKTSAPLTYKPR
jgi:hypothetical protein